MSARAAQTGVSNVLVAPVSASLPASSASTALFSSSSSSGSGGKHIPEADVLGAPPADTKFDMAEFERMLKSMNDNPAAATAGPANMSPSAAGFEAPTGDVAAQMASFAEQMEKAGLTSEDVARMMEQQGLSQETDFAPRAGDPSLHIPDEAPAVARADIAANTVTEEVISDAQEHSFQTETKQMLDIVTNSLYTDKEVFLRELISNASDALEKARYVQTQTASTFANPDLPMEIRIFPDDNARTLTIQDTGIGMTKEELVTNLGTIAKSGSKQFAQVRRHSWHAKILLFVYLSCLSIIQSKHWIVYRQISLFFHHSCPCNSLLCASHRTGGPRARRERDRHHRPVRRRLLLRLHGRTQDRGLH